MIAYVKGKVAFVQEGSVIIDVQGIGYEIFCPDPFKFQTKLNEDVFVYTYQHVREDVQALYGFLTEDEKFLFTKLISVSGIGPKSAVNILGTVHVPEFIKAVEAEDEKFLTQFPGVGKKTARQIILDLKGKLTSYLSIDDQGDSEDPSSIDQSMLSEAEEALKALGYSDQEIRSITPQLMKENVTKTDEVIRKALSLLMKQ
ncbi:MAG TPA: Holliday junction branch migration protein RuvA [Pseudogracilibacillus sp.]|nr:Holliday junction branch migration protein RuvA [Pseudogracilibacillus sp.]